MKKLDKTSLLYLFILIHPILDLFTALMTRFDINIISIGIVFRGVFIFLMIWYLIFFNSSKYKRKSILYLIFIFSFCIMYFLTKTELLTNFSFLFNEVIYLFKYMYFLIAIISLFNFCNQYKLDKDKLYKIFSINIFLYSLFLVIPFLTDTGFDSYFNDKGVGIVGWFYSANEIGVILATLFPIIFICINKKVTIFSIITILLSIFSIMLIGTKAAYFGTVMFLVIALIYYIVTIKKKKYLPLVITITSLSILVLSSFNLPVFKNINKRIDKYKGIEEVVENEKTSVEEESISSDKDNKKTVSSFVILSSRDKFLKRTYEIYEKRGIGEKLFGIGFSNRQSINNSKIEKLIEMDFFDILFRYGIIGFLIYIVIFIIIAWVIFKYIFRIKFRFSFEYGILTFSALILCGAAFVSGHVLSSPGVSIYLVLIFIILFKESKIEENGPLDKDKVTFLALHLGVGGIESSIVNTVNYLADYKQVNIISFYRLDKKDVHKIDKRVNITYLHEGGPNREEFVESLKNYRLIKATVYALKGIIILAKKQLSMIKAIKRLDGIVISTRMEFSILLNYYGNEKCIKVAWEHCHHNDNKKYIKTMKYSYANIDYIFALTNSLRDDYIKFIGNNKTRVLIMPNMLITNETRKANLDSKRIIYVGRLESGKRVNELIDIMKYFDNELVLNIVGTGSLYNNLEEQIKSLNLVGVVNLLGGKSHEEVISELLDSSIFVFTSLTEALPMVLLEAMSVGLPVIAYETKSGVNDIVDNGMNGYIIKNRNDKEFIKKLSLLARDIKARKRLGNNAINKAKMFSPTIIGEKWLSFINNTSL